MLPFIRAVISCDRVVGADDARAHADRLSSTKTSLVMKEVRLRDLLSFVWHFVGQGLHLRVDKD